METNNRTQWVIIGAAVVVLIAGGIWLSTRSAEAPEVEKEMVKESITAAEATVVEDAGVLPRGTVQTESDGEIISVADQPAGMKVLIGGMELTRASWVAVRDETRILGAAWFPSSATAGEVTLQRSTVAGNTYSVVVYVDDGDKAFDFRVDKLISVEGKPVGTSFTAN
jgi:hypothetical protein